MTCPFCRFGAWLQRKLKSSSESSWSPPPPLPRDTSPDRAPLRSYIKWNDSPTPYPVHTHWQTTTSGSKDLDNLRAENPPCALPGNMGKNTPPRPREGRNETICAAIITATNGLRHALAERDPAMVAAQAIRAISLAVSTSRSYSACIAATTAAEFQALRCVDIRRCRDSVFDLYPPHSHRSVVEVAFDAVKTSDATVYDAPYGWPWIDPPDDDDEVNDDEVNDDEVNDDFCIVDTESNLNVFLQPSTVSAS